MRTITLILTREIQFLNLQNWLEWQISKTYALYFAVPSHNEQGPKLCMQTTDTNLKSSVLFNGTIVSNGWMFCYGFVK